MMADTSRPNSKAAQPQSRTSDEDKDGGRAVREWFSPGRGPARAVRAVEYIAWEKENGLDEMSTRAPKV